MKQDSNPTVPSLLSTAALTEQEEVGPDLEQRIREKAYEIWNLEGQPEGRDREHWERAEALIQQEATQPLAADLKTDTIPK
jgi:Protein of unknown function (DUF2934)